MAKRKKKAPKRGRPPGRNFPVSMTWVMTHAMKAKIKRAARKLKISHCEWLRRMSGEKLAEPDTR